MPAVYVSMPFIVEGQIDDPDNFPNNVLNYTWYIVSQPVSSNLTFFNANSITPTVTVDTPGDYTIGLAAFDGAVTSTASYSFTASPSFAATSYASGACGSGAPQFLYALATSITSQTDANTKAAAASATALTAVLNCCPAAYQLTLPADAPSGAAYGIYVLPDDILPHEDFYSDINSSSGYTPITVISVSPPVLAGSTQDFTSAIPASILAANKSTNFLVVAQEFPPFSSTLNEITDFTATVSPLVSSGNATDITINKVQRHSTSYPAVENRALGYQFFVPQPRVARFNLALSGRVPPLPIWQINAAGYETTATWAGSNANALGLFLLTGGSVAAPTSEVLVAGMNSTNTDLTLCASYLDFFGFSQIPYQGSLYGTAYSDRRAFAPIPRTGIIGTAGAPLKSWAQALSDYVVLNNLALPYNFYFRAGNWNGTTYTWYANSVPLYFERSAGAGVSGPFSLTPAGSILGAANSVITLSATDTTSGFFATVQGVPALYLDLYRWNVGFPAAATVGVYQVTGYPSPTGGTRLLGVAPGPPAGRGYDVTNLALNITINGLLKLGSPFALAFYLEDGSQQPIATSFGLAVHNLTTYAPSSPMFAVTNTTAVGILPAGTSNMLAINNAGTKLYLVNFNG